MKNSATYFFVLFTTFVLSAQLFAQNNYRRVDWLHGFGGFDDTKLAGYANRFGGASGDRQMTSHISSYNVTGSITDINNNMTSIPASATNNIGIGHSLGGVVCRNFEVSGNPKFDGVITLHSPNKGASIAHSINNGSAATTINNVAATIIDAINAIHYAVSNEASYLNLLILGLNQLIGNINSIFDSILSTLGVNGAILINPLNEVELPTVSQAEAGINAVFGMMNNPNVQNVVDDIDPTSAFMSNLNSFQSTIPRIEVHGYEKDNELLRLGCTLKHTVWNSPLALANPYPDNCLIDEKNKVCNQLGLLNAYVITKASVYTLSIIRIKKGIHLWDAAGDIGDARDLLQGDLEAEWEDLIGTEWETVTSTHTAFSQQCQSQVDQYGTAITGLMQQYQLCQNTGGSNCAFYLSQANEIQYQLNALQTDPGCYETVTTSYNVPTDNSNAKNDGLILESQMTTGAAGVPTYQNKEVNHMEVLNHPEMWKNLNAIFDRGEFDFFNTPPR